MRPATLLVLPLLLFATAPLADATYAIHLGAHADRCTVADAVELQDLLVECPDASHSAYMERIGCGAETCDVRVSVDARAARDATTDAPLLLEHTIHLVSVRQEATLLCADESAGNDATCSADTPVTLALAPGACDTLRFATSARDHPVLETLATSDVLVCRFHDLLEFHGPSSASWFATQTSRCEQPDAPAGLFNLCNVELTGHAGPLGCDADSCVLFTRAAASARSYWSAPKLVTVTLETPAGEAPVCAALEAKETVRCQDHVTVDVPLAAGSCADASVVLRFTDSVDLQRATVENLFQLCRNGAGDASIMGAGWD